MTAEEALREWREDCIRRGIGFVWFSAIEAELAAKDARIAELEAAVIWMSGSDDFAPGGKAHEGWLKVRPLVVRL